MRSLRLGLPFSELLSGCESPMLLCDPFLGNEEDINIGGSGEEAESVERVRVPVSGLVRLIDWSTSENKGISICGGKCE